MRWKCEYNAFENTDTFDSLLCDCFGGCFDKCLRHGPSVIIPIKRPIGSATVLYDFLVTVKAAPHECVTRTGQP